MKISLKQFHGALLSGVLALALGMPLAYADEGKMGNPCAGKTANPCAPAADKKMEKKKMKKKKHKKEAANPCAGKNPCAPKAGDTGAK